ncbi:MAG TPA: efflux transporter outer membrane subunit [Polyangia bacterium]
MLAVVASGCAVGPNYKRPTVPMTATFREQAVARAESFADLPWWEVFRDSALTSLLREAVEHNLDLADAVARIDVARQNARISTDQLLPSLSVSGGPSYQQIFSPIAAPPGSGVPTGTPRYATYQVGGTLSWEIDLWGRLRRLRQAALADFLGAQDNARGVIVSIVGDVAQGYFNLVALDLQLEVARRTAESRQKTLALFTERAAGGVGDGLQTASEEANLQDALATIPALERQIAQQENQLALLLGRPPAAIARTADFLRNSPPPPDLPVGVPAALLERRPDVRQAEAHVISANAQVGAAFAALFPSLTVNANGGFESTSLASLFTVGASTFGVGLVVAWLMPLLNGAQLGHAYRGQQAAWRSAVAEYRKSVLVALVDVANAQAAVRTLREQRARLESAVRARQEAVRLSTDRYRAGVASYLDVVQAEQNLFPTELQLAQTVGSQFAATAQLYRALGGGWMKPDEPSPPAGQLPGNTLGAR